MKKKVIIIVVLIAVSAVGYFYLRPNTPIKTQTPVLDNKVSTLELMKDPKYKNFILQGKAISISGKTIAFESTVIKDGMPTMLSKTATLTDQTAIVIKTRTAAGLKETKAALKDISIGQSLAFYTSVYPYDEAPISPYLIEILK